MIQGVKEHLFAVLRDILFMGSALEQRFDLSSSAGTTDAVFHILRNARLWTGKRQPNLVVCWGGHSIGRVEYDFTKDVGYELGLRGLDICTGCGPGAMKGPMKGATIAHAKQRYRNRRYIGITEPGIIASEAPNPIVNALVVMPDIEKRLEAFVRCAHGIVVFPGGAGTAEELLFLLGVLLHPENEHQAFPIILAGPSHSEGYFRQIDEFVGATLGDAARDLYRIVVGDPGAAAAALAAGAAKVCELRKATDDAYYFNWLLKIERVFQLPFEPTHENVAALDLHRDLPIHVRAANLRRAFSAVVSGNVKEQGIRAIQRHGPFEIRGDASLLMPLDRVLRTFVAEKRMKLGTAEDYAPCYRIVS